MRFLVLSFLIVVPSHLQGVTAPEKRGLDLQNSLQSSHHRRASADVQLRRLKALAAERKLGTGEYLQQIEKIRKQGSL